MSPSLELLAQKSGFRPTPSSLPPSLPGTRLDIPTESLPVHNTPLNPIQFLLRAALICPGKLAIAHPNVRDPAFYSYSVWYVYGILIHAAEANCQVDALIPVSSCFFFLFTLGHSAYKT